MGFFGTRNMGFMHQQLIEVLAYAMLLTVSAFTLFRPPRLAMPAGAGGQGARGGPAAAPDTAVPLDAAVASCWLVAPRPLPGPG